MAKASKIFAKVVCLLRKMVYNKTTKQARRVFMSKTKVGKRDVVVAGIGHRFCQAQSHNEEILKVFRQIAESHNVVEVATCCALGADLAIAECAISLGHPICAILPMERQLYLQEIQLDATQNGKNATSDLQRVENVLNRAHRTIVATHPTHPYLGATQKLVEVADVLVALWDGVQTPLEQDGKPINQGGTYHGISMALNKGLQLGTSLFVVKVARN